MEATYVFKQGDKVTITGNRIKGGMYHIFEIGSEGEILAVIGEKHHVKSGDLIQIVRPEHLQTR